MWLHYWKAGTRALLADRFFALVNLLGLAAGLAAVAFIGLYVKHEFSYDRWLPRSENLFRVDTVETPPGQALVEIAHAPGPLKELLQKDFPQVAGVTRAFPLRTGVMRGSQPSTEDILVADPNFFSLLGLPMRAGGAALRDPGTVALSERAALRYFGTTDVVGERLTIMVPERRDFTVGAVFETIPENSHMAFDIVIPFASYFGANSEEVMEIPTSWAGSYFHTYVRLRDGARAADVEKGLPALIDRNLPQWLVDLVKAAPHEFYQFRLIPVQDLHFDGTGIGAMKPPASRASVLALSGVALLILFIASINFANLMTARSTLRAREVALRKVVGARRAQIMAQFLAEALFITACAGLIALALVELGIPWIGRFVGLPTEALAAHEWQMWLGLILLVLVTAIGSGFYPSLVVSRIRPATVFNRDYALRTGGRLRSLLVVVQFAISIGLITITIVMAMQTRFAQSVELGFDRENLLVVRMPEGPEQAATAVAFAEAMARNPDAVEVAISSAVPSDPSENNMSVRQAGSAQPATLGFHRVDSRFFETYGVTPVAGRTASMQQEGQGSASIVINRAALKRLGHSQASSAIGEVLRTSDTAYTIVGVVPDLHFRSLHAPVREEMYVLDDAPGGVVSIRYRTADLPRFLAFVDRAWAARVPDRAVERMFLDESIDALYARERTQAALVASFSVVAILLSCLGLLAMAAFSAQRRTREIAVRKVLGARSADIVRLLLWEFSRPVLLANLIAWPVAWLVLRHWLNGFAYRIDLPLSAFAIAGLTALVIAFATVGAHALRIARTRPALALRHD